jgi:dipeptidyl aminopeptidase/acylaminoacyl peptidase
MGGILMAQLKACARLFFGAVTLWGTLAVVAQAEVPASAFAVLPEKAPSISPDGTHVAMIREQDGRPVVAIYDTTGANPPLVVKCDESLIDGLLWVKNDVVVIYTKINMKLGIWDSGNLIRPLGNANAILINQNKQVQLTPYVGIEDIDLDDPDIVYVSYENALYRMSVHNGGRPKFMMVGIHGSENERTVGWLLDGHGKLLARVNGRAVPPWDTPHAVHTVELLDNGSWRQVTSYNVSVDHHDGIAGMSEDGNAIIRLRQDEKSTASINRVDLATGTETVLFRDPVYDEYRFITNDWNGRIEGFSLDRDLPEDHYFDPKLEALQKGLEQSFPGLSVHMTSADLAFDKIIVRAEGPRTPTSYYLLDRSTHKATALVATYPSLDETMLGEVKPYPYKARDGLDIAAYLTLPPGKPARNLPLIVMPHGGPDARDDMEFDWWAQFFANRGYAVLKTNFRGSRGYGRAFTESGFHEWGLKMQDDISDGVRKAVADGVADPKRVCIVGASYGGYAALAGATLTPDLYACVVSYAGISNLPNLLGYANLQFGQDLSHGSFDVMRIGDAFADIDRLKATSPALHADRVTAPVLLLHSELDVTVPIGQSEEMADALKKAGKKVEFIRMPGDDHYFSLASTRLRLLLETERFVKDSIGN